MFSGRIFSQGFIGQDGTVHITFSWKSNDNRRIDRSFSICTHQCALELFDDRKILCEFCVDYSDCLTTVMCQEDERLYSKIPNCRKTQSHSFSYVSTECCARISPCGSAMEYFFGAVHNTKYRIVIDK